MGITDNQILDYGVGSEAFMTILVTGGLGFIGSHTVVELINSDYQVIIIDNLSNAKLAVLDRIKIITGIRPTFFQADVTNTEAMREIFLNNEIEGVIHLAGLKAVEESIKKPLKYYYNNIVSTIVLSQMCIEFEVKKLVFSSSATVYGNQVSPVHEDMSLGKRTNPYGETKAMNERILFDLSSTNKNLEITILRYFNPVGAHKSRILGEDPLGTPSNLMPVIIKVATGELEKLKIFGGDYQTKDGTAIRDYIHVVDLAKGHIKAIENKSKGLKIYNLGTGQGITVLELVNEFMKVNKINIPYEIVDRRVGDIDISYADVSKAEKEINWTAALDVSDMVRDSWCYTMAKIVEDIQLEGKLSPKEISKYKYWLNNVSSKDRRELLLLIKDIDKLKDSFYKALRFGTGGLREKMGLGSNRMNAYTVGKATQGLANYINDRKKEAKVIIAFDTRKYSKDYARTAASVLAANGIKTFIFSDSRPTPELSFAIRKLSCDFGVVITASHNPPIYNGYKIYEEEGVQIVPSIAKEVMKAIEGLDVFKDVKKISFKSAIENEMITELLESIDKDYFHYIEKNLFDKNLLKRTSLKVLYTALHGTGALPISTLCKTLEINNYAEVKTQMRPDIKFGDLAVPNPEVIEVFDKAIAIAEKLESEIILGTDPDCDRVGVLVRDKNAFRALSGNQVGVLLLNYILENIKETDKNLVFIKTIVTSDLAEKIASKYGVRVINTLTGFKYIGEKISSLDKKKEAFLFAYEESNGYLYGNEVRDKDGVMATLLTIEMAAYYKAKGKNLIEILEEVYQEYGYFKEELKSITLEGQQGEKKIHEIMDYFRNRKVTLNGFNISQVLDYRKNVEDLPKANVLKFVLSNEGWFVIRPSGTEPKVKLYFSLSGKNKALLEKEINSLINQVVKLIRSI